MFRILVIRLGSMGDVLHSLPAVASLKHSFPRSHVSWVLKPRWIPLVEGNPYVDEIIPFDRTLTGVGELRTRLRREHFHLAVDLQGLIQSALVAAAARPDKIVGLDRSQARERVASLFYSIAVRSTAVHRVDRYLDLVAAAGAANLIRAFPLPQGTPEGTLPSGRFVLACPSAGWGSKQWPLDHYEQLAAGLDMPLVVNGPPQSAGLLGRIAGAQVHLSGVAGLIDATRKAHAVVGVDSGPTDPATHGPYGGTLRVLRNPHAVTSYKRLEAENPVMRSIEPDAVLEALHQSLGSRATA